MNDSTSTSVATFRRNATHLAVVGGLLFLGAALLAESFDRLTLLQWLYRLDFRYWFPSFAYPLWLILALILFDVGTFSLTRINAAEAGKRRLRFSTTVFAIKVFLVLSITYLCLNHLILIRSHWFWWYLANLLLFAFFLAEWSLIYQTKNRDDLTPEMLNVRRRFLIMSYTVTCELGIYNLLNISGLLGNISYSLWEWFGYGIYSHMAALTFSLICAVLSVTFFMIKEWLEAIRQACKVHRKVLLTLPQQQE